jgi:hypothetical protein
VNANKFPRAYSFSSNEDVSVQSFLTADRLSSNFWLPLSPQAFDEVKDLQSLVADVNISSISDSWVYPWGKEYTSSKFYRYCFHNIHPHESFLRLWKSKCTPRVKFFGWLVLSDHLNTRNMLRRRHYTINSGYLCLMCIPPPEETIEHLIFHCVFSQSCWQVLDMFWQATGNRLQIIEEGKHRWHKPLFRELFLLSA